MTQGEKPNLKVVNKHAEQGNTVCMNCVLLPVLLSWWGHVICGAVTCDVASCTFLHLKLK